jgi:hypothetical protein
MTWQCHACRKHLKVPNIMSKKDVKKVWPFGPGAHFVLAQKGQWMLGLQQESILQGHLLGCDVWSNSSRIGLSNYLLIEKKGT